MNKIDIIKWEDIKEDYSECLLLGNGASIAVDPRFRYASLLEEATKQSFITDRTEHLFNYFNTQDFELILSMLSHTNHVNRALEIKDNVTHLVYAEIRDALIKAVQRIHPEHHEVEGYLPAIANFMGRFKTVVSLNYDLIVYWAMLSENDVDVTFKDCFDNGLFRYDWAEYRIPIWGQKKVTLVFYPHGNLALANSLQGAEAKIAREDEYQRLLSTIIDIWTNEQNIPLFVSEGLDEQKRIAIARSSYLSTVSDSILRRVGKAVAIYGWSLSDNDEHILYSLLRGHVEKIAVSVWTKASDYEENCLRIRRKIKNLWKGRKMELKFFDSESAGCWIN